MIRREGRSKIYVTSYMRICHTYASPVSTWVILGCFAQLRDLVMKTKTYRLGRSFGYGMIAKELVEEIIRAMIIRVASENQRAQVMLLIRVLKSPPR